MVRSGRFLGYEVVGLSSCLVQTGRLRSGHGTKCLETRSINPESGLRLPGEPGQFHLWPGIGQGS